MAVLVLVDKDSIVWYIVGTNDDIERNQILVRKEGRREGIIGRKIFSWLCIT